MPRDAHPVPLSRRLGLVLVPVLLAVGGVALPGPARSAGGGLVIVAETRYQVQPEQNRVHVTLDAVATSHEPDTSQGRVFYSGASFAVQPTVANVVATAGGQPLAATITRREEGFAVIEVTFGHGVFFQQSYAYTVSFDLVDPGGHGTGDLRVGHSLAALPVWAFGTEATSGSSVRVDLPPGFAPDVQGDAMDVRDLPDGGKQLSAEPSDPFRFFAYLTADRPGAFEQQRVEVDVNGQAVNLVIRAWDDDRPWGQRIIRVMRRGLPELERMIGVEYAGRGPLTVEEAATSRLGEYAGVYNPVTGVIRVRYDADAWVALHEAAHVWFNASLFRDRWIGEAWAEFYGVRAGMAIGATGRTFELTDELKRSRVALNDWGAVGVESLDVEDFAYAATYTLAQQIAGRTELDDLRAVWTAATDRELSYQPAHPGDQPERAVSFSTEDWQRLLDLLEERTGQRYADLWERWVVNQQQRPLLAERSDARDLYQQTVQAASDWELPREIRRDLSAWDFDEATDALAQAGETLEQRAAIQQDAQALGLEPPPTLRSAFEHDLGNAAAEATAERATLAAIAAAQRVSDDELSLLETIGALGSDPAARLREAGAAFEEGDLTAADHAAAQVVAVRDAAADAGRLRVAVAGGGILALDAAWMAGLLAARRRRRRGSGVAA